MSDVNVKTVGEGNVVLLAGGGKVYTDIAARFVRSERDLAEIIASPYSKEIVQNILRSGHMAATEFDWFIFGIEGYSRVTEVQLVRKRLASYLIKSGRAELNGKRAFTVVLPSEIQKFTATISLPGVAENLQLSTDDLLSIQSQFYDQMLAKDIKEEDARYLKPQATEMKAIIGMNAHGLLDWFGFRTCKNAQTEIRDLARKMLSLCKKVAPDIFKDAGPNCKRLGYCPENDRQHLDCRGHMYTKDEALRILKEGANEHTVRTLHV